jgi:hypothetical protein
MILESTVERKFETRVSRPVDSTQSAICQSVDSTVVTQLEFAASIHKAHRQILVSSERPE